jgi:outer membrane biosynthesis protein TonB
MFDRFVAGTRPNWKRRAVLITSLGLHAAVAIGLVVASVFHVAEITPPLLAIVFNPAAPPPTAKEKKPAPTHKPATATRHTQPALAPPVTQPDTPEQRETPEQPDTPGDGHRGGDGPDSGKGQVGGEPNWKGTDPCSGANCVSAPPPRPRNVAPHALDAARVAGAMPHLPASIVAQRRGLGDTTFTAKICVDQSGAVSSVSVLSGIPGADAAIVATLRDWRYKSQPIPVCFVSQFVFAVQDQ